MKTARTFPVSIEKIRLFLQFFSVGPIIVPVQQCNILAPCVIQVAQEIVSAIEPLVPRRVVMEKKPDDARKQALIAEGDSAGSIHRLILAYQDFNREIGTLHQSTFNCLGDIGFMIERRDADTDLWRHAFIARWLIRF